MISSTFSGEPSFGRKLFLFNLILLYIFLSFHPLGKRGALDSNVWIEGGDKFVNAIYTKNWGGTHITSKPGVSVLWIAGIAGTILSKVDIPAKNNIGIAYYILPFVLLDILFLYISYRFLTKVDCQLNSNFGESGKLSLESRAFLVTALLALNPQMTTSGLLVWTDRLLFWSVWLSFISYLVIVRGRNVSGWKAIVPGMFFGIGLLTKVSTLVIVPSFLLLVFIVMALHDKSFNYVSAAVKFVVTVVCGVLIFYAFYPAAWLRPLLIIDRASEMSQNVSQSVSVLTTVLYYLKSLLELDPILIVVLFILTGWLLFRCGWSVFKDKEILVFLLPVGFLMFFLSLVASYRDFVVERIVSQRYITVLFPILFSLAAQLNLEIKSRLRSDGSVLLLSLLLVYLLVSFKVVLSDLGII